MSGSKRFRTLCLLLCLSVLLAAFSVNVNAASGNLISSDLSTWKSYTDASFTEQLDIYQKGNIFRLGISNSSSSGVCMGLLLDKTSLTAGHSYTLTFSTASAAQISEAWGVTYTDDRLSAHYQDLILSIGIGFVDALGNLNVPDDMLLFSINESNYSNYLGKSLKASFVAGSYTGTPCVCISMSSLDGGLHYVFLKDFSLVDNDDNSAELKGIKGFLHSIRWDLVGGLCDEEDCPHSVPGNEHLSLTERMSAGFSSMFENIGSKFEEGSTLNVWFNNLSSGVIDLGDRVDGFFDGLGDRISGFFDNLKTGMTDGFSDVGSWFTDLGNDLGSWFDSVKLKFQEVGDSITAKFQEIGDKFTEFFDKFKPRVHVNLKWVRGLVNWSSGELMLRDDNYPYVVVSELFEIPHGTKYLLDFVCDDVTKGIAVHKYDLNGNFICSDAYVKSFEGMELESGYCYRFRTQYTPGVEELSIVNDYVVLYSDEGWLNALLYNFKTGLLNLFVPDESYLSSWKSDIQLTLEQHLGFIYTSLDFVGDFFTKLKDLLSAQSDGIPNFVLPAVDFELNGVRYYLWSEKTIELSFLNDGIWGTLYDLYKVILYIIIIFALLNYGVTVYGRIMHQ